MSVSLVHKTFLNVYVKFTDGNGDLSVKCIPLGQCNTEAITNDKISALSEAVGNYISLYASYNKISAQILAVKRVEGYKLLVS